MFLIFWIFWVLMMMFDDVLEDTDLSLVSFYKSVFVLICCWSLVSFYKAVFVLICCCLYFDFCDGFWFCFGFLIFLKMMFLIFWIFWVLMMKFDDVLEDNVINY
ncbi:hypothetical protein HanXRQr2_Chr05g0219561 [Helianthus annuus]|uniref:Uncharacterized protein n=1 Tax=Helianthus annuus TaxID=4232 RepID=A0A9K3NMZ9_HELAN|nr:hypothetical protein HanXRQr2_Chr05g0219561 [Helianthus annuus]